MDIPMRSGPGGRDVLGELLFEMARRMGYLEGGHMQGPTPAGAPAQMTAGALPGMVTDQTETLNDPAGALAAGLAPLTPADPRAAMTRKRGLGGNGTGQSGDLYNRMKVPPLY